LNLSFFYNILLLEMNEKQERTLRRVNKHNSNGKYETSIELLKPMLEESPNDVILINTMANTCQMAEKNFLAIKYFYQSAQQYLNINENAKALAIFKKITKIHEDEPYAFESIAKIHNKEYRFDQAARNYARAANKYRDEKKDEEAIRLLNRAIEINPENQRFQLDLVEIYKSRGNNTEAINLYLRFSDTFMSKGKYDEAKTILENILKIDINFRRNWHRFYFLYIYRFF